MSGPILQHRNNGTMDPGLRRDDNWKSAGALARLSDSL
jgi:hypothetical protein